MFFETKNQKIKLKIKKNRETWRYPLATAGLCPRIEQKKRETPNQALIPPK